jgi:hypothetical protein
VLSALKGRPECPPPLCDVFLCGPVEPQPDSPTHRACRFRFVPFGAVKIPLGSLNGEKMQNLRSALNRVTREKNIPVLTSSDEEYLYVWRADPPHNTGANE